MSWLKRLLGGASPAPGEEQVAPVRVRVASHGRRIVSLPELDIVGQRATSRNGRFTLIWADRYWHGDRLVHGRFVLLDGDAVVVDRRMERPQDGKVADDGTFILNDWGDSGQLSGTFHAFRSDGGAILSRSYSANLLNNGLSDDGRLAVCQTCNSPGSPDSSILSVFDLSAGSELASWTAESGWARGYAFPAGGELIRMLRGDRPSLDYSLNGELLDRRVWLKDEAGRGTLHVIRQALAEGEAATGLTFEELRAGVRQSLADGDKRFEAEAWRLLGEIEEIAGDAGAALAAFETALSINPRIGVTKRAAAIRKALS